MSAISYVVFILYFNKIEKYNVTIRKVVEKSPLSVHLLIFNDSIKIYLRYTHNT